MPREARQQAEPEQGDGDDVGQDLVVDVDHRQRDQRPGEEQRRDRLPVPAEAPHDRDGEDRRGEFHDRVARRDACLAVRALAPSSSQLTTGMFWCARIGAPQCGQAERGTTRL